MRTLSSLLLAASLALTACHGKGPAAPPTNRPDPIAQPAIDRAALKAKLAARRQAMFERFLAYREARIYPLSPGPGRQHIWIDASGRLCAAATMISATDPSGTVTTSARACSSAACTRMVELAASP